MREAHITSKNIEEVTNRAKDIAQALIESGLDLNDRVAVIAKLLESFEDDSVNEIGES